MKRITNFWSCTVPSKLDELADESIKQGLFRTKSDLIRTAVRKELENCGFNFNLSNSESSPKPVFLSAGQEENKKVETNERSINC